MEKQQNEPDKSEHTSSVGRLQLQLFSSFFSPFISDEPKFNVKKKLERNINHGRCIYKTTAGEFGARSFLCVRVFSPLSSRGFSKEEKRLEFDARLLLE